MCQQATQIQISMSAFNAFEIWTISILLSVIWAIDRKPHEYVY